MNKITLNKDEITDIILEYCVDATKQEPIPPSFKNQIIVQAKLTYGIAFAKNIENNIDSPETHLHKEGAVLLITGAQTVNPSVSLSISGRTYRLNLLVYHITKELEFIRSLAHTLIAENQVDLFPGLDEEYLYEVFSDVADTIRMEEARKVAPGLPMYEVKFEKKGGFSVQEMGKA